MAHSTFPINESFDRYNPLKENKLDYERRIREKRDAVIKGAEGIVRRPLSGRWGTNVRDAMQLAERRVCGIRRRPETARGIFVYDRAV